jgi:hypothetical protein
VKSKFDSLILVKSRLIQCLLLTGVALSFSLPSISAGVRPKVLPAKKVVSRNLRIRNMPVAASAAGGDLNVNTSAKFLQRFWISPSASNSILVQDWAIALQQGYLLAPLDLVLTAASSHIGLDIFVGSNALRAQLVDFDLANGWALLKVPYEFPKALALNSIRNTPIADSETLYAVTGNAPAIEVKALAPIRDGGLLRLPISQGTPLGTWYFFDAQKHWVAMRPSSQEVASLAVSSLGLFRHLAQNRQVSLVNGEDKSSQLVPIQDFWTTALNEKRARLNMANWQMGLNVSQFDCQVLAPQVSDKSIAAEIDFVEAQTCHSRASVPLASSYSAGVDVLGEVVTLRNPKEPSLEKISRALMSEMSKEFEKSAAQVNFLTSAECSSQMVSGIDGQKVFTSFCTSALKNERSLNDSLVSVAALDLHGHLAITAARLRGFSQKNTRLLLGNMAADLRSLK